jgi:hypothetical protein
VNDYDWDDYGVDDFEAAQDDMGGGGLFDDYDQKKERTAGEGSFYEQPQPLDRRELLNSDGKLPRGAEKLADTREAYEGHSDCEDPLLADGWHVQPSEDELEAMLVNSMGGYPDVWGAYEEHMLFHEPYIQQYEYERQQDRYWSCVGWERSRARRAKRERYHGALEYYRERARDSDKALRERDPEAYRARYRAQRKKRRQHMTEEQREAARAKQREYTRQYRLRQKEKQA